ncbi:Dienelactone hydrolase family [Klebsiella pneumoniae]|uniref:dienelactone hydrolase family protein n=1 Tax=Klebsiella pneumoniae TaxID=573 RepID=UPI000DE79A0C|nr:dienelactone hydrolase family protein [Klebsiella pneumoniae]EMB1032705.1 dienelactone hydrolase family protein [Klebsiella pneumoniae]MBL4432558.1 dienelactone hydrolase family protein [Klebsiella pneumoniae]MBZ7900171.1 dienelactone hydrolase family protein [Klebsiella pneumoniae]MCB3347761.1 dienelactone hydrolase family protein [Klebsiella pneumoniae]MCJ8549175.1 dienelactone hydrolase family protein [Klebsiella pneumoniae]
MLLTEESIHYHAAEKKFTGVLVRYISNETLPGILLAPNMMGTAASSIEHAHTIARKGYVVLVADLYGHLPDSAEKAANCMNSVKDSPAERLILNAALARLAELRYVNADKLAAVGFCYGGHCVLELARSGAPLALTACFHGTLDTRIPAEKGSIRGKVAVFNGADDPFVTTEQIQAFAGEMASCGCDFQLTNYAGAVHSFTYPRADVPGKTHYNEAVRNHAFGIMFTLLREALG